ncbi:MAG: Hpt domain-containing protein [Ruminococcus sp.]|nr:Hpt domain-containing protein [Ruminococcus sp.]
MNLKECYEKFGGSFEEVSSRLPRETMIKKFIFKFLNDKSYENLMDSLDSHDYSQAFIASHTLKGVCQNLAFTRLHESSHDLTEALRGDGSHDENLISELREKVTADYELTTGAIMELQAEE